MIVASGTLRFGFSITPADTAALSTPRNAHNAIDALVITADAAGMFDGFHPASNTPRSNQNQPSNPTTATGRMPATVVIVVKCPTDDAPRVLSHTNSQITRMVQMHAGTGASSTCANTARYPVTDTAIATLPSTLAP